MARIVRVSPPELAREFPGPQASSRVTLAPFRKSCSADHPPNAPAPTTITEVRSEPATVGEPNMQAVPAIAEAFKKLRRDLFGLVRVVGNTSLNRLGKGGSLSGSNRNLGNLLIEVTLSGSDQSG